MQIYRRSIYSCSYQEPSWLKSWIDHEHPLTDKLLSLTGDAQLEVLSQSWQSPDWWDTHVLESSANSLFKREIIMRSHGKECWYARTLIPEACYALNREFFDRLQNESIKNLIFESSQIIKVNRAYYSIDQKCIEFYWVNKHINTLDVPLWVRLTEYSFLNTERFYLCEILLPSMGNINC